jgi:hypothetical protein
VLLCVCQFVIFFLILFPILLVQIERQEKLELPGDNDSRLDDDDGSEDYIDDVICGKISRCVMGGRPRQHQFRMLFVSKSGKYKHFWAYGGIRDAAQDGAEELMVAFASKPEHHDHVLQNKIAAALGKDPNTLFPGGARAPKPVPAAAANKSGRNGSQPSGSSQPRQMDVEVGPCQVEHNKFDPHHYIEHAYGKHFFAHPEGQAPRKWHGAKCLGCNKAVTNGTPKDPAMVCVGADKDKCLCKKMYHFACYGKALEEHEVKAATAAGGSNLKRTSSRRAATSTGAAATH